MKPLTKPQLRMLKRRGFYGVEESKTGELWIWENKNHVMRVTDAMRYCRRLNDREKSARYRRAHRPQINAYMRRYTAAKAGVREVKLGKYPLMTGTKITNPVSNL